MRVRSHSCPLPKTEPLYKDLTEFTLDKSKVDVIKAKFKNLSSIYSNMQKEYAKRVFEEAMKK